jgi:hypothetical protein
MTITQIIALVLGGVFAVVGIALFAKKGSRGKNTIKMFGMEFQLAGSSLVVFVLGCLLIFAALRVNPSAPGPAETQQIKTTHSSPVTSAPPEFVTKYVYSTNEFQRTEYNLEAGQPAEENMEDFLRLTRLAFGVADRTNQVFQAEFAIKNTSRKPVLLDLNERFFSLTDDLGNNGKLIYFCCASQGDTLSAGEERTVQLFFLNAGWHGKGVSAHSLFFRVNGFLPAVSAAWKTHPLITKD